MTISVKTMREYLKTNSENAIVQTTNINDPRRSNTVHAKETQV